MNLSTGISKGKIVPVCQLELSESVAYHCTLRVLLTSTLYITSLTRTFPTLGIDQEAETSAWKPIILHKVTSDASIYFRQSTDQCMTDF